MNIFQFFKASGQAFYIDEKRQRTFFKVDGGVKVIPWDKSYEQWISEGFYDREYFKFTFFTADGRDITGFVNSAFIHKTEYLIWPILRDK